MSARVIKIERLELLLAEMLQYGTWVASAVTAVGLVLALIAGRTGPATLAMRFVTVGIGCFILLPILRVLVMLIAYVREKDYRFVAITGTVLAIIIAGIVLGIRMKKG